MFFSKFGRGHVIEVTEGFAEVMVVCVTETFSNIGDLIIRLHQDFRIQLED